MYLIKWTIDDCAIAKVGKISTGFSLFTFSVTAEKVLRKCLFRA